MARGDLVCSLVRYGLEKNEARFQQAVNAVLAEERSKHHDNIADKIEYYIKQNPVQESNNNCKMQQFVTLGNQNNLCVIEPKRRMDTLLLTEDVKHEVEELIIEQKRADFLRSYGVEPRSRILMIGPPGNGKTSLAEAIATALELPLCIVKYENVISQYLGATASKLAQVFEFAQKQPCVLFLDEFETLGRERGSEHEVGEMRRVVGSLLTQMDALPSHVIMIAATNHDSMLDSAAWRRFQIKFKMEKPGVENIEAWFRNFEETRNFDFGVSNSELAEKLNGLSYAEVEEFALSVYRKYLLQLPAGCTKEITETRLDQYAHRKNDIEET